MVLLLGLVGAAWIAVNNTGEYARVDISLAQTIVTVLEGKNPERWHVVVVGAAFFLSGLGFTAMKKQDAT